MFSSLSFVSRIVSRLSVWEWARPAPQRLPDAAERVSRCSILFTSTWKVVDSRFLFSQINHVFQLASTHLTSLVSTRTSLLAHLRSSQTIPAGGRAMLKYLSKHVGALIKHIRVSSLAARPLREEF